MSNRIAGMILSGSVMLGAVVPASGAGLFQPEDFRYLGAFRTPVVMGTAQGTSVDMLSWCKGIEAYYPYGDPGGDADGFPGSLFGIGHGWVSVAYELSIPAPVISDNVSDLPVAQLLQAPHDVCSSIEVDGDALKSIEWLPEQPGMTSEKLFISFGQHYQYDRRPTHGWVDLTLSNPNPAGAWNVGTDTQVNCLNTNEYLFSIPKDWADANVGGKRLACGRYREGQVACGPSIIAFGPWEAGNPPVPNADLPAVPLVLYKNLDPSRGLTNFCWADNWTGGAWLKNDELASVAIVGTKGYGNCWYGWQDGTTPEQCATWPGGCEANGYGGSNRGYYATSFRTVVLLYFPDDLARVARGEEGSWEPQPYAVWDITPYMIRPESTYEIGTGGVAYDEAHGLLYITERGGDTANEKPIIHVFAFQPGQHQDDDGHGSLPIGPTPELYASPNPFRGTTTIHLFDEGAPSSPVRVAIYDVRGNLVNDLGVVPGGSVSWDASHRPGGIYFVRASSEGRAWSSKISLLR